MSADNTAARQRIIGVPFKPGQSGNPAGRPKGSRNKLGEAFIAALHKDFKEYGVKALELMRESKPNEYIRVIASLLPKELNIAAESPFDNIDDAELRILYDAARSVAVIRAGDKEETGQGKSGRIH